MKRLKSKITFVVEKTNTGFSAYSEDYPIFTTGKTVSELLSNAQEAASLYFEEEKLSVAPNQITFSLDWQQFFQEYRILNHKLFAQRIGLNPTLLSQYISGKKKPSKKQQAKILEGIHQIGHELAEMNLLMAD
ncbi:MAG: type II toxin-antitoxin system HicB family antitoxin [Bacteroidota bacterium]